ncbi:MAG: hypothetical protein OHK93_002490 [Ramalina farinacea]|uniref:Bromodomain associated domain-containing protein n=1 Tax=Ramalina farinacea TaxID=258253 RepID=A0AA43TTT6_9LECA|nr:hypothetical protein [Ramalina farinacea]
MASPSPLHLSLLRPPILHILRAAGFTATKSSVLDTVVDLASRYLILLATRTAIHTAPHSSLDQHSAPTITDVRMALRDTGALWPQLGEMEELAMGKEDMRGIENFLLWCRGPANAEIRRIAGMTPAANAEVMGGADGAAAAAKAEVDAAMGDAGAGKDDFLTVLKKKYAKTGEEARYQGTALGKEADARGVKVEGGEAGLDSIAAWEQRLREKMTGGVQGEGPDMQVFVDEAGSESSGSPLSELSGSPSE